MTIPRKDCVKEEEEFDFRQRLFFKEELSDVAILVQSGPNIWRYPSNKMILSAASEVFAELFESDYVPALYIKDLTPESVSEMLSYIYTGRSSFYSWKSAFNALEAAYKFKITPLVKESEAYLSKKLTLQNVCSILELAIWAGLDNLKKQCLTLCGNGAFVVLNTKGFCKLRPETVRHIFGVPLAIQSEVDVLISLLSWAGLDCCSQGKPFTVHNVRESFMPFFDCISYEHLIAATLIKALPPSVVDRLSEITGKRNSYISLENLIANVLKTNLPVDLVPRIAERVVANFDWGDYERIIDDVVLPSLPGDLGQKISDHLIQTLPKKLKSPSEDKNPKRKKITFPLKIPQNSYFVFNTKIVEPLMAHSTTGNHVYCMRFSVETDVYLISISMLCSTKRRHPSIQKLQCFSQGQTLFQWAPVSQNTEVIFTDTGTHMASVRDSTEVHEVRFDATCLLTLKAETACTVELDSTDDLRWPQVQVDDNSSNQNLEVTVYSDPSWCITKMIFLPV